MSGLPSKLVRRGVVLLVAGLGLLLTAAATAEGAIDDSDAAGDVATGELSTDLGADAAADESEVIGAAVAADASVGGQWAPRINLPLVPGAMANLPSGKVLMFSGQDKLDFIYGNFATETILFDPDTGTFSSKRVSNTGHDMFCPGITNTPDGKVIVTGGKTAGETSVYDPASDEWIDAPDMRLARGYQSGVTLHDGTSFVLGGSWSGNRGGKVGEILDGATWRRLDGIRPENGFLTRDSEGVYRADNHMWLFPWGERVFHAGPSTRMNWIGLEGSGSVTNAGNRGSDGHAMNGTGVMYEPGRILTVGGSPSYQNSSATDNAHVIDITGDPVVVRQVPDIAEPRTLHHSVVLPTGEVVVVGGQKVARLFTDREAVMEAEIFNPDTETWTVGAAMEVPRTYHSAAVLLQDGRVLAGGGGQCGSRCPNHPDVEIYSPPYLFNSDGSAAARPTLTSVPESAGYGQTIEVQAQGASEFSLVRLSNSTHSVNIEQRRIPLSIASRTGDRFALTMPANGGIAPPGQWMLFAMSDQGTPSVAEVLQLGPIDCGSSIVFDEAGVLRFGGQDEGDFEILDDGTALRVFNNGWKAIEMPLLMTPNTVVEFDFRSSVEGEEHAIGFSNSLSGAATRRRFKLLGTQNTNGDAIQDFANYSGDGADQRYVIPVGQFMDNNAYRYLVMSADDDAADNGESIFSNIRFYEVGPDGEPTCDPAGQPNAIGGTVTDPETGPRPGVEVDLFEQAADGGRGAFLGFTTTDEGGRYQFDDLESQCYVLTFIAPDGETFDNGSQWLQSPLCLDRNEQRLDVDALLGAVTEPSSELSGQITFTDGAPADGVSAVLYQATADGSRGQFLAGASTDSDGVYRFAVDPGCYVVDLVAPEEATFTGSQFRQLFDCVETGETVSGLDAILSRGDDLARIVGSVGTAEGSPVEGVQVDLFRTAADGSRGTFLRSIRTGADGSFQFDVDPTCHTLTIVAPEGETFDGSSWFQPTRCLEAGEVTDDLVLTLD